MGILEQIKSDAAKTGGNKKKLVYFRPGEKKRIRFLQDMDEGYEFTMHTKFDEGISAICAEHYNKPCKYCGVEGMTTRTNYCWSVWDYDENDVKLFFFAVTRCTPIPPLVAMYENYGTLTDRDYVVTVQGKATDKTFTIIPMDKAKFRNSKAKPYSKQAALKILAQAFPDTTNYDDDADDGVDVMQDDSDETEYDSMKPQELFKLCKERDIEAEKKKPKKYYINLLVEYDEAQDDWGDDDYSDDWDDDDDEWEDE